MGKADDWARRHPFAVAAIVVAVGFAELAVIAWLALPVKP